MDIKFKLFGDPQGGTGGLFHGETQSNRFDELYVDDAGHVRMVVTVNPPDSLLPTLEALVRRKPSVRGREADIARADFDLRGLLA